MVVFPHGFAELFVHVLLAAGLHPSQWLLSQASTAPSPGAAVRFLLLEDLVRSKRAAIAAHRSQIHGLLALALRHPWLCRVAFGVERYLVQGQTADRYTVRTLTAHA
jgi:LmbE family N-acetylglucosaminyl deacetylase